MTYWNYNIEMAPKTGRVIVACKCGTVTVSEWLPPNKRDRPRGRWEMLATGEAPLAWQPFNPTKGQPLPIHPEVAS